MFGLIDGWLFSQLNINCNLEKIEENNIFRDGCVFVNILKQYGLVNDNFRRIIHPTVNKEECIRNLKLIKPVFDMLKIKYNGSIINDIVENKTGTIINLLYAIYISLENKQHLYFITQQNFEKIREETVKNLKPVTVSKSVQQPENNGNINLCLEQPLIRSADVVNWYKNKYKIVKNNVDKKVNKLKKPLLKKDALLNVKMSCKTCQTKYKATNNSTEVIEDLPDLESFLKSSGDENLLNYEQFIARYKEKQHAKAVKKCFENAIQYELLYRTWSKIEEKQEEIYNSVFSGVLLKQSQYEKQILTKLIQAQKESRIQNENKIWASQNILNEHEYKISNDFELKDHFKMREKIHINEQKRVLELHKKLYKEKKEIIKKENHKICEDIVLTLIDLAFSAAEYKSKHCVEVSKCLWENWMQHFIKSQPIRIPLQSLEDDILEGNDIDYDEAIYFEKKEDEILNENDVEEYLTTCGKWFHSNVCLEHADINENYLAFIIYRLLAMKYPLPPSPSAADLPHFKISGVLLNFHTVESIEKLKVILNKPGIHIFDTNTAVKKCLAQFQFETSPSPEGKVNGKKNKSKNEIVKSPKKQSGKGNKKGSKSYPKNKGDGNEKGEQILNKTEDDKILNVVDKETQTSIAIETEDGAVSRSPLGLLGEKITNMVKGGQSLDDSLLVSVITEYLKTLEGCDGWVLLNYPATIEQAFYLELALTGKKIPLADYISDDNITFQVEHFDDLSEKRKSKLLDCPLSDSDSHNFKSYLTVFVKIEVEDNKHAVTEVNQLHDDDQVSAKDGNMKDDVDKPLDLLQEFYGNQGIYKGFYSEPIDVNSLKALARVILWENDVEAKPSIDLFGEETLKKLMKGKKPDKKGKLPLTDKKRKTKGDVNNKGEVNKKLDNDIDQESFAQNNILEETTKHGTTDNTDNLNDTQIETGEQICQNWNFVSLPLHNEFGILLATLWENIESCYINNIKDVLFENRIINLRLHPYCIYVKKEMAKVINKTDLKQNIINLFQEYYNNVTNDLRTLPEMKNQLHCRVMKLQQNLWEIADERKTEIEAKRQELIDENWLVTEMCMLINNFLSLVQTEFNRSLETLKILNDYYMNMLEKIPLAVTIRPENQNIVRINEEVLLNIAPQNESDKTNTTQQNNDNEDVKSNFIARSLVYCFDEETPIYLFDQIFSKKIEEVRSNFNYVLNTFLNQNKSEADFLVKPNKQGIQAKPTPNKRGTSIKPKKETKGNIKQKASLKSHETEPEVQDKDSVKHSIIEEWHSTINTEGDRFRFRLDLINERAKENIMEFYCFLESLFCNLRKSIMSRYDTEISNINSTCEYLRTAIEEEAPLLHHIVLGQEKFFLRIKDSSAEKSESFVLKELKEDFHECIFTVKQLHYLLDIFKISGPQGVIRKQPLCYILQDLMLLDTSDKEPCLPKIWCSLSDTQLRRTIDEMFGLEFGVDWRDFIIYNLDIPYPTVSDILHISKHFLLYDLDETELISLEDYDNVKLWFENELPSSPKHGLRFALVKELLAAMFKVDDKYINYTTLLLYFCKDFNPVNGFKKALSLSLGKNVVTSKEELEVILKNEEEIKGTVCSVLKDIIDSIVTNRETAQLYEIQETVSKSDLSQIEKDEDSWKSSQFDSFMLESFKSLENNSICQTPPSTPVNEYQTHFPNTSSNEKSWVTRIPVSSVLSVLNASFFYQDRKFTLKNIYLNSLDDEADSNGLIEAYDLVSFSCIQKLFTMTNKFKISITRDILRVCLNDDGKSQCD